MENLIKALKIFAKYTNKKYPTGCEHDVLYVYVNPSIVSEEDIKKLEELGFDADREDRENFYSFTFGSA